MDTAYLATSYSYEDKDYFEPSLAVLPTPCSFQQPQHGHLYPIVPQPIHGGTQLTVSLHWIILVILQFVLESVIATGLKIQFQFKIPSAFIKLQYPKMFLLLQK